VGLSFTLFFLAGAMLSPVAGWLGERYGPRKMMIVASLSYCSVMVLVAFVSAPWELWLSFGILRGAVQAIFMVPLMAAVSAWFRAAARSRHRLSLGCVGHWSCGDGATAHQFRARC